MKEKVRLRIVEGPMKGKEFLFEQHDTFLFGRMPHCHACLTDDTNVSRYHFLLEVAPPSIRLRDLGSLNGTYVNNVACGRRTAGEKPSESPKISQAEINIQSGDRIQVGQTVFVVDVDSPTVKALRPKCSLCGAYFDDEDALQSDGDCPCRACRDAIESPSTPDDSTTQSSYSRKGLLEIAERAGVTIESKIGKGGMGVIYLAHRRTDKRPVAVKLILPKVAVDSRSQEIFKREMSILSSLVHPNIVRVHLQGYDQGLFYFVMEYCDLGDVSENRKHFEGKLSLEQALPIFRQVLRGMDYAHASWIVHRDIKPANILLKNTPKGIVAKVADFGLAKCFDTAGLSGLTATGTFSGTCDFMPREQLTDYKYVHPVSDVWSLAATFFYMLTESYPRGVHVDRDPLEVILTEEPLPIQDSVPSIPDGIAKVIDKALRTNPQERYQTAGEFRSALKRVVAVK